MKNIINLSGVTKYINIAPVLIIINDNWMDFFLPHTCIKIPAKIAPATLIMTEALSNLKKRKRKKSLKYKKQCQRDEKSQKHLKCRNREVWKKKMQIRYKKCAFKNLFTIHDYFERSVLDFGGSVDKSGWWRENHRVMRVTLRTFTVF